MGRMPVSWMRAATIQPQTPHTECRPLWRSLALLLWSRGYPPCELKLTLILSASLNMRDQPAYP